MPPRSVPALGWWTGQRRGELAREPDGGSGCDKFPVVCELTVEDKRTRGRRGKLGFSS